MRLRLVAERNGVKADNLLEARALHNALRRLSGEEAVRGEGEDAPCAVELELVRRLAQRPRRVNHVVDDDDVLSLDVADEVHARDLPRSRALLHDHCESGIDAQAREALAEALGAVHAARVGRDDDGVDEALLREVLHTNRATVKVVDRHTRAEEALDLAAVQVHRDHAVAPHRLNHARHVRGGDRHASRHLAILPRVAVVRDHCRDAASRRTPERRDHQEELHQVIVDRDARRLDHVHILAADGVVHLDVHLYEGEMAGWSVRGASAIYNMVYVQRAPAMDAPRRPQTSSPSCC